jgi:hypothetical protein
LDVQICLGDSVQLQASGGDAYSWLPIIGLSNPSISNPMASPAVTTQYVLNVTTLDGCASTDAVTVTVLSTNFQVSADETICIGNTAQISASGATTYLWSPNVDISNPNISNPQVFPVINTDILCRRYGQLMVAMSRIPLPLRFRHFQLHLQVTIKAFVVGEQPNSTPQAE